MVPFVVSNRYIMIQILYQLSNYQPKKKKKRYSIIITILVVDSLTLHLINNMKVKLILIRPDPQIKIAKSSHHQLVQKVNPLESHLGV